MPPRIDPCTPLDFSEVDSWFAETDVLVIGYGGAGACASLEAQARGVDVTLLEVASAGGGTTALSGGQIYLGGGTPIQRACGFTDTREDMEAYIRIAAGANADLDKVRVYCEESLAHFDWLVAQGVVFNPGILRWQAHQHARIPVARLVGQREGLARVPGRASRPAFPQAEGLLGRRRSTLMATLRAAVERTRIRVEVDTRALTLIREGRRIVGALCRKQGEVRAFRARRGVVLCCGGFIMNREMVAKYAPRLEDGTPARESTTTTAVAS